MDACPDVFFIGVVKIFALTRGVHAPRPYGQLDSCPILLSCRIVLVIEPRLNIKYRFNWAGKIEHFSKVSNSKAAEGVAEGWVEGGVKFMGF